MERQIWGSDWVELQSHLQRQEARMAVAGVPATLVDAFRNVSTECWRDLQRSIEISDGEQPGISSSLLDERQTIHRAIRAHLLGEREAAALTRVALDREVGE